MQEAAVVVVDGVVGVLVVDDGVVALVGGVNGEVSSASPVPQPIPTNTSSSVSVHHFIEAIAWTSTYHCSPLLKSAQEANDPPISAHMRYLDHAVGSPILPDMRYLPWAAARIDRLRRAGRWPLADASQDM